MSSSSSSNEDYLTQYYEARDLFYKNQFEECEQELDRLLLQPNLPETLVARLPN